MRLQSFTIDLTQADGYVVSEDDVIKDRLVTRRLFSSQFLYTVIDGNKSDEFLRKGTYREDNSIFAFTHDQLQWVPVGFRSEQGLETYLLYYEAPALAIFKRDAFDPAIIEDSSIDYEYCFRNPSSKKEALLALAYVQLK